ncbi:uncharacterized protein ARMOST_01495 [Armillaria ostoyae]|uniref:DUF6535 domain-containing protein n=1 Tax=Armillaria ostoyae TaxID=47428 RepID=A0A284QP27_ARMOS|nr:uncharacterized protein ARMOST_01495 [Armillaria ostoyae]
MKRRRMPGYGEPMQMSVTFDANMVEDSRDSVDVLLVFAGLFSAVVSTFVTQASQGLSADYTQMSASFLFELVAIQRALASGATVDTVNSSPYDPSSVFVPSIGSIWVNGLWFTSLVLSLTTALIAVLVKQWLHYYVALPSGTPREHSHVRQFRYMGFQQWHVLVIVGLLPVLMHIALAIFFVGLVVFLIPLRVSLSWVIGSISIIVYAAYVITAILPIISPQCPYHTPLSDLTYATYTYLTRQLIPRFCFSLNNTFGNATSTTTQDGPVPKEVNTLKRLESEAVKAISDDLSVEALHWLFSASSNPTVQSIVIQAIGGLPMLSKAKVEQVFGDGWDVREAHIDLLANSASQGQGFPHPAMELRMERMLRFEQFIPHLFHKEHWSMRYRAYPEHVFPRTCPDRGVYRALSYNDPLASPLSSPAVDFKGAVLRFQPGLIDKLLQLFSTYDRHQDHPSISIRLRVLLSLTEFTLSRLSTTEPESGSEAEEEAFRGIVHSLKTHVVSSALSAEENTAVFDTILGIVENGKWALLLDWARVDLLRIYVYMLSILNINPIPVERFPEAARSLPGLNELVSVLDARPIDQYSHFNSLDLVCDIIGYGLREDVRAAYDVFLDMRCLEVFSRIPFHPRLVGVVKGYVNGLHGMARSTPVILAQHLNYLHQPENLAATCVILAVNDWENVGTEGIKMDVMSLVQLRPWDPAWPVCRDRLQAVVESDQFFSSQRRSDHDAEILPLTENEIELERRNIRVAIGVLDAYFSGSSELPPETFGAESGARLCDLVLPAPRRTNTVERGSIIEQ